MRRRYRFNEETKQMEEVALNYEPPARVHIEMGNHYEGLRATDGTDISTRRKHADYMKANNLALVDDFKGTWAKAAREREAFRSGQQRDSSTREALARAIHQRGRR